MKKIPYRLIKYNLVIGSKATAVSEQLRCHILHNIVFEHYVVVPTSKVRCM